MTVTHKIPVILFSHPTCTGCSEAIRRLQDFVNTHENLDFTILSLAGKTGLSLAREWNIESVPSIVFNNEPEKRIVGVPDPDDLASIYNQLTQVEHPTS